MNSDQAREHFSDAYEGGLTGDTKRDFEAALSTDRRLASEYESFRDLLDHAEQHAGPVGATPDLLRGVQKRLRGSAGARFYGDRLGALFVPGGISPLLLGICVLALVALMWLALEYLQRLPAQDGHGSRAAPTEFARLK